MIFISILDNVNSLHLRPHKSNNFQEEMFRFQNYSEMI